MFRLKLLVDLVSISSTTPLRIRIDPIPQYPLIFLCILLTAKLWRLSDRTHASDGTGCRANSVICKIFQSPVADRFFNKGVGMASLSRQTLDVD